MPVGPHTRRLTINLPSDVAEVLACRAAADGRSLSAYIVRLLCRPSPAAADDLCRSRLRSPQIPGTPRGSGHTPDIARGLPCADDKSLCPTPPPSSSA